jgi:ubiquinone/menaquinone biosynthesis C-methylase UbiE
MRDYTAVTEIPDSQATREQLNRLHHRYDFALPYCINRCVLEVACGSGIGIGYLQQANGTRIVGGDYTLNLLKIAQSHYQARVPLLQLDAQWLPFVRNCFDIVLLFEAIYYILEPERFLAEVARVLTEQGTLIIGTVNKDWRGCARSEYSIQYHSVPELNHLLISAGFSKIQFYGAFRTASGGTSEYLTALLRQFAITLNVFPKTLKSRELLKRMFYGRTSSLPPEISATITPHIPSTNIDAYRPNTDHKILYVVASSPKTKATLV